LKVNVYQQPRDTVVLSLEGEFDALSAPDVRAQFDRIIAAGAGDVILDLGGVTFMDSSGAGALVYLHKKLVGSERALELVGVVGQPLDLLTLLRIKNVIPVNQRAVLRPDASAEAAGGGSG
jgi:anti-anti-sigma factor